MWKNVNALVIAACTLTGGSGLAMWACGHDGQANAPRESRQRGNTVVDVAVGAGQFKTLAAALGAAGFVDALKGEGPFTVFAPTDAAFAKLGDDTLADLLKPENKEKLRAILRYHVVRGNISAIEAVKAGTARTRQGGEVSFTIRDGKLLVNGSVITQTDVKAANGVIHVIDTVLTPTEGTPQL